MKETFNEVQASLNGYLIRQTTTLETIRKHYYINKTQHMRFTNIYTTNNMEDNRLQ